jgi:hypothetical protein
MYIIIRVIETDYELSPRAAYRCSVHSFQRYSPHPTDKSYFQHETNANFWSLKNLPNKAYLAFVTLKIANA